MLKFMRFFSLLLTFLITSQMLLAGANIDDEILLADANIDDEMLLAGANIDDEMLLADASIDDDPIDKEVDDEDITFIGGGSKIEYILYARPTAGLLHTQLHSFWKAVKAQKLKNPPVLKYPPHVTLTGFFTVPNAGTHAAEQTLIKDLQAAIASTTAPIQIQLGTKVIKKSSIDYIPLKSPILRLLTINFLDRAGVKFNLIRPRKPNQIYHITLRQDTNQTTKTAVRKLEKTYINLLAPSIRSSAHWELSIYKKTGGKLDKDPIYTQAIPATTI